MLVYTNEHVHSIIGSSNSDWPQILIVVLRRGPCQISCKSEEKATYTKGRPLNQVRGFEALGQMLMLSIIYFEQSESLGGCPN
jgi:hypothetical protein